MSGDRHVLVRCLIANRVGAESVRFVEHTHYRLWHYLMANKHELVVRDASVCLWMVEDEYRSRGEVFDRSGEVESVERLSFAHYDRATGLCQTTQRFVPSDDAQRVLDLLLARVPKRTRESADFVTQRHPGAAVVRSRVVDATLLGRSFPALDDAG